MHYRDTHASLKAIYAVLLIGTASVEPMDMGAAARTTFARPNTHPIPVELSDPPAIWAEEFAVLAAEAQLQATRLGEAIKALRGFWQQVIGPRSSTSIQHTDKLWPITIR